MRRFVVTASLVLLAFLLVFGIAAFTGIRYAYEPSTGNVISRNRPTPETYDLWGHGFSQEEANRLLQTAAGQKQLSPQNGAVKIDDALLRLGRRAFYKETFGYEVFLTDVVGILDGPLRLTKVIKAILELNGRGTTNLRVEVPETVIIGTRTFKKGSYFDTGLDVPRGSFAPLGLFVYLDFTLANPCWNYLRGMSRHRRSGNEKS
jgi:hypothetical protein